MPALHLGPSSPESFGTSLPAQARLFGRAKGVAAG